MMMPRKKRRTIFILEILVIIAIILSAFILLYNKTDMFKSNKMLFSKYAGQLFDNMSSIFNEENMNEMEEILQNNKLSSETIIKAQYSEDGNTDNVINSMKINITGKKEQKSKYNYQNIEVSKNEEEIAGFEYLEEGEIFGIRLNGIKQFLSTNVQNNNNKISTINSLVNTNLRELINLNSEEMKTLRDKYLEIIINNMESATFSKKSNITLEIDGQSYKTNAYTVTITKEQFNNMYIAVLEQLKEDEILLSKIENIDNCINSYYSVIQEDKTSDIRQEFINKVEAKINEIKDTNIGNDERTITVYETNRNAISLAIDTESNLLGLDVINSNEKNFINIIESEKVEENEKENGYNLKIEKNSQTNSENIKVNYDVVADGKETTNELTLSRKMENSELDYNLNINRKIENKELTVSLENVTQVTDEFEEKENLVENENNILLENLTDEQKETVKNSIEQNATEQINRIFQVMPLEDVKNTLVKLELVKAEAENIENEGTTEAEKIRFNSNFELFEGENINKERIIELINIAKESLEDIRITKYKEQNYSSDEKEPAEYKLIINKNTENTELAEQFIDYIEEKWDDNFTVRIEYDDSTGLVNNVYITVSE